MGGAVKPVKETFEVGAGHGDHHVAQDAAAVAADRLGRGHGRLAGPLAEGQPVGLPRGVENAPARIALLLRQGADRAVKAFALGTEDVEAGVLAQPVRLHEQQLVDHPGIGGFAV